MGFALLLVLFLLYTYVYVRFSWVLFQNGTGIGLSHDYPKAEIEENSGNTKVGQAGKTASLLSG